MTQTLNPLQIAILNRVASGHHSFDPDFSCAAGDPRERLLHFQTIVNEIDALYERGLLSEPSKNTEKHSGHDCVDHVMVHALTADGAEMLEVSTKKELTSAG